MIRIAKPIDIDAIAHFWYTHLSTRNSYLRFDSQAMREVVGAAVSSAKHFVAVSDNGQIDGVLLATVERFPIAEKSYAQIQLLEGNDVVPLYDMFDDWQYTRRAILAVGYSSLVPSTVSTLLEAVGFKSTGSMLIKYRHQQEVTNGVI